VDASQASVPHIAATASAPVTSSTRGEPRRSTASMTATAVAKAAARIAAGEKVR